VRLSFVAAAVVVLAGCTSGVSPTAKTVYQSLVAQGCLEASPDGPQAVQDEFNRSDRPDWLSCMFDGGTVDACAVPCGP